MTSTDRMWNMYNRTFKERATLNSERNTHLRVAQTIREAITDGLYIQRLPSMDRLARTHSVSRGVIFRALALLQQEGLVESVPGVAYYVAGTGDRRPTNVRMRELIEEHQLTSGDRFFSEAQLTRILGVSRVSVRRALGLLEGEGILSPGTPQGRTVL